ncbi:MAG: T9SS type A sorting domain-containing protein [Saprospiraceae bacterium]|nr:T9SS type A sorting domain-containing protein [Saprospiraceae bacterium]
MKNHFLLLIFVVLIHTLQGQPLFRVLDSSIPCGEQLSVIPNFNAGIFSSYQWNFGDGITSTLYQPADVAYTTTGTRNVSLTVSSNTPFVIINTITITADDGGWEETNCGNTPDFYLEFEDVNGNYIFETSAVANTFNPTFLFSGGIINTSAFVIKIWERDNQGFCQIDDYVGTITIPAGATAGSYQNGNGETILISTQNVTSTTFTKSVSYTANVPTTITGNHPLCPGEILTLGAPADPNYTYQWSTGAQTQQIPVSTTGTYRVTVTALNGCTGVSTSTVTASTVEANPIVACAGGVLVCTNYSSFIRWLDQYLNPISGATGATYQPTANGIYYVERTLYCDARSEGISYPSCVVGTPPTVTVSSTSTSVCAGQPVTLTASGATTYQWNNGATTNSITVNPTAITTYTVIGTTNGLFSNPVSTTISVIAAPTVTVNSASICAGQTATLTASGATTYQWSNGETGSSINVSPTTTTTYTVTGTTTGCSAANPVSTTVTVNVAPTVTVNSTSICAGQTATLTASGATTYQWSNGATQSTINVSPTTTTTYTVTGTTAGCSATPVSAVVTVNSSPTVTVNSASICAGQTATLTASGATTYQWSNGATGSSISVSPTTTTTYTVTGTTAGCTATPVTAIVNVNATPNDSIIINGSMLTAFQSNATYQWIDCDNNNQAIFGATNQTFTPSESGTYGLTVSNGVCTNTSICYPIIISAINEVDESLGIRLFPNPNDGLFILQFVQAVKEGELHIFNEIGQRVYVASIDQKENMTIDLTTHPSGVYLVMLNIADKSYALKVVKR